MVAVTVSEKCALELLGLHERSVLGVSTDNEKTAGDGAAIFSRDDHDRVETGSDGNLGIKRELSRRGAPLVRVVEDLVAARGDVEVAHTLAVGRLALDPDLLVSGD